MLTLVSDVSMQKDKQSSFAWVIAHNTDTLWRGIGLAPGHANDIYLGQAKAFGLLAGLTFLQYYISCYKPESFTPSLLHCFCNNAGVITHVMDMVSESPAG